MWLWRSLLEKWPSYKLRSVLEAFVWRLLLDNQRDCVTSCSSRGLCCKPDYPDILSKFGKNTISHFLMTQLRPMEVDLCYPIFCFSINLVLPWIKSYHLHA